MRRPDGTWIKPPPPYAPIQSNGNNWEISNSKLYRMWYGISRANCTTAPARFDFCHGTSAHLNANRIYHCNLSDTRAIHQIMTPKKPRPNSSLFQCNEIVLLFQFFFRDLFVRLISVFQLLKKNNFCCVFAIFIIFDIDAWHSNRVRVLIPFVYFHLHLRTQRQWTVIIWTISFARSRAKDQATFTVYHNLFTHFTNYQSHKMHRPKRSIWIETSTRRSQASHLTTPH